MAEPKATETPKAEAPKFPEGAVFFKNTEFAGERVLVKESDDATAVKFVTFNKYAYKVRGADVIEGYLYTADKDEIKALESIAHVEKISEKEYKDSLKGGRQVF